MPSRGCKTTCHQHLLRMPARQEMEDSSRVSHTAQDAPVTRAGRGVLGIQRETNVNQPLVNVVKQAGVIFTDTAEVVSYTTA